MSQQEDSGFKTYTAGEAITQYARVKHNSSKQVVEADIDDKGIGVAQLETASGDPCTVKLWTASGTFKMKAAGAFSVNDLVYPADEGLIDDVVGGGSAIGRAGESATAAGDIVEVIPVTLGGGTGLVYANVADSAEVENTTDETAFDKSVTIDGGALQVGDVLHIIARAYVVDQNSTDTLTLKLYVGTEEIVTTGAVDVADADIGYIEAWVTIRSLGSSGTLNGSGLVALGVEGTVQPYPWRKDQATEDISGDVAITVKATWSVAHADNEVELEQLIVQKISQ